MQKALARVGDSGPCRLCPRCCGAHRSRAPGLCGSGAEVRVARAAPHFWEEPCLSGTAGSGAVFFTGCPLRCSFCQNRALWQKTAGKPVSVLQLAEIYLALQRQGVHNLNLVTAGHWRPQVQQSLALARSQGLNLPVAWNTGSYETPDALRALAGDVDIWLADLKFFSRELSARLAKAPDYFAVASAAIKQMALLAGPPQIDESGLLRRGLMLRILVLPGQREDAKALLRWAANSLPRQGFLLSLMRQYTPPADAQQPEGRPLPAALKRPLSSFEYKDVLAEAHKLHLLRGYTQGPGSALSAYTPQFNGTGVPG